MLRAMVERMVGSWRAAPRTPVARVRAAAEAMPGSRRHGVRAAGGEWRAHCTNTPRATPASLDGGLDRTAVLVWRDGARAVLPMGR